MGPSSTRTLRLFSLAVLLGIIIICLTRDIPVNLLGWQTNVSTMLVIVLTVGGLSNCWLLDERNKKLIESIERAQFKQAEKLLRTNLGWHKGARSICAGALQGHEQVPLGKEETMSDQDQQFADVTHNGHVVTTRKQPDGSYEKKGKACFLPMSLDVRIRITLSSLRQTLIITSTTYTLDYIYP